MIQTRLTKISILYFLCVVSLGLKAQVVEEPTPKTRRVIEGTVYEKQSRKPLAYASVALLNNQIGTITNAQGKFRLIIPARNEQKFVKISYIGYKTGVYLISKVIDQRVFMLAEDPRMLSEVTFEGLKTATILKKAIEKIPTNYYQQSYTSEGFYRVKSLKDNKEYISIGEGACKIYQTRPARKNQVVLKKLRTSKHDLFLEGFTPLFGTTSLLNLDIVNRSERLLVLDEEGLANHVFQVAKVVPYENTKVYVISFVPKVGFKGLGYKGEFWVDTKTFAFLYLDFALSEQNMKRYKVKMDRGLQWQFDKLGISFKLLHKRFQYRYKKVKDTYYLYQVNVHQKKHMNRTGVYSFIKDTYVSYLVTAYQPWKTQPFSRKEVIKSRKWQDNPSSFFEDIKPGYWQAYNILLSEVPYATVAKQLKAANEMLAEKARKLEEEKRKAQERQKGKQRK